MDWFHRWNGTGATWWNRARGSAVHGKRISRERHVVIDGSNSGLLASKSASLPARQLLGDYVRIACFGPSTKELFHSRLRRPTSDCRRRAGARAASTWRRRVRRAVVTDAKPLLLCQVLIKRVDAGGGRATAVLHECPPHLGQAIRLLFFFTFHSGRSMSICLPSLATCIPFTLPSCQRVWNFRRQPVPSAYHRLGDFCACCERQD